MNFRKNSKGITLIALVVTIIVLLILAGVSLSLVAGSNGIIGKASSAVEQTNHAQIAEEVELAMAELQTQYYEEKYVDKTTSETYADYAKTKLTEGITTSSGAELKLSGTTVSYTPAGETEETATGTFDATTGAVTIAGTTTGGAGNAGGSDPAPETPEEPETPTYSTLFTQIGVANYGDYVDLETSLIVNDSIALEDGTKPKTDWRIFHKDTNGTWLILADYLPYSNESTLGTGLKCYNTSTYPYNWRSETSRIDLLERLNGTSNSNAWEKLLSSTYTEKGIRVKGALDLETWVASWNAKGYTELYTNTYSNKNGSTQSDGLDGYYVGTSENSTTTAIDLSSTTNTGYGDALYYPHKNYTSRSNAYGYWLASPSADGTSYVMLVRYDGYVYGSSYFNDTRGVRPAVYLPSGILAEKNATTGVWEIQ